MRILVVEDEPELARTLAQALEEAGYAVDVAFDGEQALRLGNAYEYDAVILDLLLPKRHGLSVLKDLKMAKPKLPVVVLTALDQVAEKIDGLDRGADAYVTKPFDIPELLAHLRAVLRRGSDKVTSALVRIGDLEVDLAGHVVRRRGRPIKLTPREYSLLALFVSRRGVALTRSEIGERVVDRAFETTSNLIDVSIAGLRAKLGDPPLIHTVRGLGYRFDLPEVS
jgi:DNA-binding response OmpR family regulator